MSTFEVVLVYFATLFQISQCQIITTTVTTTLGIVQGQILTTPNGNRVNAFLGIPYAQTPPTRFTKPANLTALSPNPYNATTNKPSCARWGADGKTMDPTSSEDCLYVKILTPANVSCCLPVMFWIPGGGFNDGSFQLFDNDVLADNFVAKGVVLVLVNHRQGPFGFFTTGTSSAPGNWGVWDVLEALKFVRNHIAPFGGDFNKITIMGEEAGAVMAELMSLSPLAKGLYSSMILIDGSIFDPSIIKNDTVNINRAQRLAQAVICDSPATNYWGLGQRDRVLSCLQQTITTGQLVSAIGRSDITNSGVDPGSSFHNFFWRPRVDGVGGLFPNSFENLATQRPIVPTMLGSIHRSWELDIVPWLLTNTNETLPTNFNATYNVPGATTQTCTTLMSPEIYGASEAARIGQVCVNYWVTNKTADTEYYWNHRSVQIGTGYHVRTPISLTAQFMRNQGNYLVYLYEFGYERSDVSDFWEAVGAQRTLELQVTAGYAHSFTFVPADVYVGDIFSDMLTNFAKFQNPTPFGYVKAKNYWLTYGLTNCYFYIDQNSTMMPNFFQSDNQFWVNSGAMNFTS